MAPQSDIGLQSTTLARVKRYVTRLDTPPLSPLHGPLHWRRVEKFARLLAAHTGADLRVVCLFAWFHDAYRHNDDDDPDHGHRAAEAVMALKGELFHLTAGALEKLRYACAYHADGIVSDDPTIGTCWDADRLDLGRVDIVPQAEFMSTAAAKHLAQLDLPLGTLLVAAVRPPSDHLQ